MSSKRLRALAMLHIGMSKNLVAGMQTLSSNNQTKIAKSLWSVSVPSSHRIKNEASQHKLSTGVVK